MFLSGKKWIWLIGLAFIIFSSVAYAWFTPSFYIYRTPIISNTSSFISFSINDTGKVKGNILWTYADNESFIYSQTSGMGGNLTIANQTLQKFWENETDFNGNFPNLIWNSSGAVAVWHFGEATGTKVYESSNRLNGTMNNNLWTSSGKFGEGINYTSATDFVTVGDNAFLKPSQTITLEAWINASGVGGVNPQIIRKGTNIFISGYKLYLNQSTLPNSVWVDFTNGTGVITLKTQTFTVFQGVWEHVVATYNGTHISLYVNGTLQNTTPMTGNLVFSTDTLGIGHAVFNNANTFMGIIDEVRIYNKALSADEIKQHYYNGIDNLTRLGTESAAANLNMSAVYDEKTLLPLTFNMTILDLNSNFFISKTNITSFYGGVSQGNLLITISSAGYNFRNYYVNTTGIDSQNYTLTGYLLANTDGVPINYFIYSYRTPSGEPRAMIHAIRNINGIWTTVSEMQSDSFGEGTLFLDPTNSYRINAESADGVLTRNISSYFPNPNFPLRINLQETPAQQNQSTLFNGITYSLTPTDIYLSQNSVSNMTTINYTLFGSTNDIQWQMLRLKYWNGTYLFSQNDSVPNGDSIAVNLVYTSLNSTITAETYMKRTGYDLYSFNRTYIIVPMGSPVNTSIPGIITYGVDSSGLPIIILNLIALFVSFGIAGIVSGIWRTGAGIIFLGVLSGFTMFGFFSWGFLTGLWLLEVGIILYKEVY